MMLKVNCLYSLKLNTLCPSSPYSASKASSDQIISSAHGCVLYGCLRLLPIALIIMVHTIFLKNSLPHIILNAYLEKVINGYMVNGIANS